MPVVTIVHCSMDPVWVPAAAALVNVPVQEAGRKRHRDGCSAEKHKRGQGMSQSSLLVCKFE